MAESAFFSFIMLMLALMIEVYTSQGIALLFQRRPVVNASLVVALTCSRTTGKMWWVWQLIIFLTIIGCISALVATSSALTLSGRDHRYPYRIVLFLCLVVIVDRLALAMGCSSGFLNLFIEIDLRRGTLERPGGSQLLDTCRGICVI